LAMRLGDAVMVIEGDLREEGYPNGGLGLGTVGSV